MPNAFSKILLLLPLAISYWSCNDNYVPKPEGYFRIALPEKKYQVFNQPGFPYSFEYPTYAKIVRDTAFFGDKTENPWWINIDFPQFNGRIYISYKAIGANNYKQLVNDAFNLTNKHSVKASSIDDSLIHTPNGIGGMFFKVSGNVATSYQFFLTDTLHHFLRGALYFEATPNQDSLRPVNNFVAADMQHLINTFHWKK